MKRLHLFEFEDQRWFPDFLRNYMTDFLRFLSNKTPMWKPAVPLLIKLLDTSASNHIVDLASGGSGGLLRLEKELRQTHPSVRFTLTDYYPNPKALQSLTGKIPNLHYLPLPVDARKVPADLKGVRTMFLSFHHFRPGDARQILQNAVDTGTPIGIFETHDRSPGSLLSLLFSPLTVLLVTPFIRPFSLGRIIFTYLIPLVPIFVLWDGVVSWLRIYSPQEMQKLVQEVKDKEGYNWEIGKIKSGPGTMLYLLGYKKA